MHLHIGSNMSRVRQIIDRARQSLADPEKTRWSDEQLLLLLSEAQQDMSIKCLLLKKQYTFTLVEGKDTYRLPADFIKLETAWAFADDGQQKFLEVVNYKDIDSIHRQSVSDLPSHILVGLDDRDVLKLWPIPKPELRDITNIGELFGVAIGQNNLDTNSAFGVITSIDVSEVIQDSPFGIVTNIREVLGEVTLLYYYKPDYITSLDTELLIADTCDIGLKHYIVGMAMRDDMDSRNRNAALEELTLYNNEVKRHSSDRAVNFTQNNANLLRPKYRTGFEI